MSIVDNRKAFHDYFIEERYEAGIALEGWEVKAIRGGRGNIGEGYVMVRGGELFLIGAHISPLPTASSASTSRGVRGVSDWARRIRSRGIDCDSRALGLDGSRPATAHRYARASLNRDTIS